MKKAILLLTIFSIYSLYSQDKVIDWLNNNNITIRKTFDGSTNENKPANINFFKSNTNDYFNIDIGIKVISWEFKSKDSNRSFIFYPIIEWHKSTLEESKKDLLSVAMNSEFQFNKNLRLFLQSNFAIKRDLIKNINELSWLGQISYQGNNSRESTDFNPYLPGVSWRYSEEKGYEFMGRYYPYLGIKYREAPDFLVTDSTETFSIIFFKLYLEYWISPRTIQILVDSRFKRILNNTKIPTKNIPLSSISLNYYPWKQDALSLGFEYKNGYDPDDKYSKIELTSISLNIKF